MTNIAIRSATINDCSLILDFVKELAIYEKAEHEVIADVEQLQATLFGDDPKAFALICEIENEAVGFAVYFYNYSTWLGKYGIYLEDLYVSQKYRGAGAGKALLKRLAQIAVADDCGRVEWSVLDWNEPAINFYRALLAQPQDEWIVYRLTGDELQNFATE